MNTPPAFCLKSRLSLLFHFILFVCFYYLHGLRSLSLSSLESLQGKFFLRYFLYWARTAAEWRMPDSRGSFPRVPGGSLQMWVVPQVDGLRPEDRPFVGEWRAGEPEG